MIVPSTLEKILTEIDLSKMEKSPDLNNLADEFEIYEFIPYTPESRLTYCYYHEWMCTDTQVGLRIWYLDHQPVCISWQPYRKAYETHLWLSTDAYSKSYEYVKSLLHPEQLPQIKMIQQVDLDEILENLRSIKYKKHERFNIL